MLAMPAHDGEASLPMHEICEGVSYHTVAREWRFRFTGREALEAALYSERCGF